ncbi:MAG: hypothetical protein II343_03790 [Clostridia bacterium]|nr:hypothetical protein [Clostridia bacterium]
MKKRIAALVCALMLCMSCASAGSFTAKDGGALFTLRYDDTIYQLDQYSYLSSAVNGTWFCILYSAQYTIDCGAEYTDRGGMTDGYAQAVCAAVDGNLVEVYNAGVQSFVIVSAQRQGIGEVYYAETIVGGRAVYFEIYDLRTGIADANCLTALKNVLTGFVPLQ